MVGWSVNWERRCSNGWIGHFENQRVDEDRTSIDERNNELDLTAGKMTMQEAEVVMLMWHLDHAKEQISREDKRS